MAGVIGDGGADMSILVTGVIADTSRFLLQETAASSAGRTPSAGEHFVRRTDRVVLFRNYLPNGGCVAPERQYSVRPL